jgi:hypothetical protein
MKARTSGVGAAEYGAGKICGPKRKQLPGDWRKLQSEELHHVWIIKSRRTGWARHVASMG